MKSKHSLFVMLFGWLIAGTYLIYEINHHGQNFINHFFDFEDPLRAFFHLVIFSTFIGSHVTAYLINDRKKLLIKTEQSRKKLVNAAHEWVTTFDSMPYGVFLTDKDCTIMRANKYITDLSGISVKDIISNKKCNEIICKSPDIPDNCSMKKAKNTGMTETYEYVDCSSEKNYVESVTPMMNDDGQTVTHVHVITDVTESRAKENKLIQSKDAFFNMLKDLDATFKELKNVHDNLVITFSNILDAKSSWTRGHSMNVATYAMAIAEKMELNTWDQEMLRTASLLHDIGKIGTYDVILDKPEKLNDIELSLVQQHTIKGEELLRPIRGLEKILPIIRSHHEKFDGTGYPDGLRGDEIPLLARVLCVADSFDAMIANRPYRLSLGKEHATSELKRCANSQFDPHVVHAFLTSIESGSESAMIH
jgi:putative nucleotidyltransferase with HDIG domain